MKLINLKKGISLMMLGVLVCTTTLGASTGTIAYAKESSYTIPNEVCEEQEIIKEQEPLDNTMTVSTDETEELVEITGVEPEANVVERTFDGNLGEINLPDNSQLKSRDATQNTDPNYAYLVSNDMIMQGTIENVSEFRWYAFSLETKSKISILLQMVAELDADLYMFSFNQETSGLELIGGSATEGLGVQEFYNMVLEPGVYFFSIAGYEGTGNFAFAYYESTYDVENEINDYVGVATEVAMNTNVSGVIDNPDDWDYYKFTVAKPTILRYSISTSKGYSIGYAGSTGSTPVIIDGTMIKVSAGTYYFAVYSPNGSYSANDTYTVNFKRIGEYADENIVPLRAISEDASIVFQTNLLGTKYYVNGNPIDISYEYHYEDSNPGGIQSYNITLSDIEGVHCQIWKEEGQSPDVIYYHTSTRPYINVESKYLLRLMFFADQSVKFYRIMCRGTGAYLDNTLFVDPNYAIVLIDPDTGKLVDICEFNYFYDYAMGSNSITTSVRKDMTFNYSLYDYVN